MIIRLFGDLHLDGRVYTITLQAHDQRGHVGEDSGFDHAFWIDI